MAKNPPAEEILKDLHSHMEQGLGDHRLTEAKLAYWTEKHLEAIKKHLKRPGTDWEKDKRFVRLVAWKLGRVASVLADKENPVPDWAAEAARESVKKDPTCRGPLIERGGYCDF